MESNITITSNIYPIKNKYLSEDKVYLSKVEGYEALALIRKKIVYQFTEEQEFLYSNGQQCSYNLDGEYAWGLVKTSYGKFVQKCRCKNEKCKLFLKCRKDYKLDEQNVFKEESNIKGVSNNTIPPYIEPKKFNKKIEENDIKEVDIKEELIDISKPIFTTKTINIPKVVAVKKYQFTNQKEVIQAPAGLHVIVNAAPGTGKTYTLIEKLKYLYQVENLEATSEILVLCFSRAAVEEIRKRINMAIDQGEVSDDLRFLDIRTFDSFATYLIKELDEEKDLTNISYDERIELAIKMLNDNSDCLEELKHFIVDEVQDLVGVRARFVKSIISNITGGVTLLGDTCQSIYDYQVKESKDVTSVEFLLWVENRYKEKLKQAELTKNHRMNDQILNLSNDVREIIKSNSNFSVNKNTIINVLDSIKGNNNILDMNNESININKKTCILCRTNGEVLRIANLLRNNSIESNIVKSAENKNISAWVGQILSGLKYNVIDYDNFKVIAKQYSINDIESKWKLLCDLQRKNSSKVDIESVHDNFINDYSSLTNLYSVNYSKLEISTIHRSKGKEYDDIFILEDSLGTKLENEEDDSSKQELKTLYVAITRAKDKLGKISAGRKAYLKKLKGANERWVTLGNNRKRKPYISFLEVGKSYDIEQTSFIDSNIQGFTTLERQKYINSEIKVGDELILKRVVDINAFKQIRYDIMHNNILIGRMSDGFTKGVYYSIKEISGYFTDFPIEITQVYVDDIVTYFDKRVEVETEECFKKNKFWNGITINAFGKLVWKVMEV